MKLFSIHHSNIIILPMKDQPNPLSPHKIKIPHSDPNQELKYKTILTQLTERNTANDLFIKRFISKTHKKFNKHTHSSQFNTSTLETCPEIADDKEETD